MKIILVSGKIGSGKDTTVGILTRLLKQKGYNVSFAAYADPLKNAVSYMRNEDKGLYYSRDGKDKDDDQIRRRMLVAVGEAANKVDPTIFSRFLIDTQKELCKGKKNHILIVSDLRKKAEWEHTMSGHPSYTIRLKGSFKPCTIKEIAEAPIECELDFLDERLDGYPCNLACDERLAVLQPLPTDVTDVGEEMSNHNKRLNIDYLTEIVDEFIDIFYN